MDIVVDNRKRSRVFWFCFRIRKSNRSSGSSQSHSESVEENGAVSSASEIDSKQREALGLGWKAMPFILGPLSLSVVSLNLHIYSHTKFSFLF